MENKEYITIGDEKLDVNNISIKYDKLKKILEKYNRYDERIGLDEKDTIEKEVSDMYRELHEIKITCKNYMEFEAVKDLKLFENNIEKFNKLNVMECLAILTSIQRADYFSGGGMDVYYNCTENKNLPNTISRILEIINENSVSKAMEYFINSAEPVLTSEDKEFERYCKLFEEKFNRHAYIAEPSGTKEQTINAIKICLKENKDILDQLLYQDKLPLVQESLLKRIIRGIKNIFNKNK